LTTLLNRFISTISVISPDAARLCAATALSSLPIGYLAIVLPIYLNKVGINPADIGGLYAVSSIVSALLMIVFGLWADRTGRKPFLLIGLLLPMVSYAIFLSTTDVRLLTLAAGIGGVGLAGGLSGALAGSSFNALLAEKTSDAHRTFIFSVGSAAWTGSLMAGSLLGGLPEWLQARGFGIVASYQPLFWLSLVVTIAGAAIILPVREEHKATAKTSGWRGLIPHRSVKAILKLSLFMGLIGLGLGFVVELLPLWFNLKFGVSGDFLGPWYALTEALSLAAVYLVPMLSKRVGTANTVLLTQGISSLFLGVMVLAPSAIAAALLFVVRQFLMNLAWPAQQSYIMGVVEPEERATASSLTYATWGLANSLSPRLSGIWLGQGQLMWPLLFGAGSYLLSVAVFYGFFRKVKLPEEIIHV
jgi:MFS family permease